MCARQYVIKCRQLSVRFYRMFDWSTS